MLTLHLEPVFRARGIQKPHNFLVKSGFSNYTANSIINGAPRALRLDHIELLCKVLFCTPNDLFMWSPAKGHDYADNYPLMKLQSDLAEEGWADTLATIPLDELKEAAKTIMKNTKVTRKQ